MINTIDLFAGCGGLLDGFMQTNLYNTLASVEWEKAPVNTLKNRLETKWNEKNIEEKVILFDLQRMDELINGFSEDPKYGSSKGLDAICNNKSVDVIIGGPPCQAYSVAGRIRDKDKMEYDYRNYLFEYYMKLVEHYKPKVFVFENVPGMLSAMPDGTLITELIRRDINEKGYEIVTDMKKHAIVNINEYGVPQNRRRVILLGLNKEYFSNYDSQEILNDFYENILPQYKENEVSVFEAINDLPKCNPLKETKKINGRKSSHSVPKADVSWHFSRFHNERDVKIFKLLAEDIESGRNQYTDSHVLKDLYNKMTGANTNVHKYHVLRKDIPSTTILAHLYKDGLRFIHYDAKQARTLTVREAARLQSFDDDFEFVGSMGDAYKMIGNAVPPKFSKALGMALNDFLEKYKGVE